MNLVMIKRNLQVLALVALATASVNAADLKGWISDATCGTGNASSEKASRECTDRCIKNGAAPVFVTEADQKVYQVSDAELAKKHTAGKVMISGEVKGDKIVIAKIVDIKD
ncbi:MAG: hypothetical protein NTV52_10440 [Acidobacteria bacterium]|nr:hypothetical protein [Acidobacteriota bacterium]